MKLVCGKYALKDAGGGRELTPGNPAFCRYADWAGTYTNDDFDYTHGRDFWKEKLDYLNTWLAAHIVDAKKLGKPLIVEEFGKAVSAAKVYTGELPHSLEQGAQLEHIFRLDLLFVTLLLTAYWQPTCKGLKCL